MVRPITRDEANEVVTFWHRHHPAVRSHRFALQLIEPRLHPGPEPALLGVAIVGNPVARALDEAGVFEVLRLCTNGHRNAASRLLGACWRVCKEMGVERVVSYLRFDELGTSYRAAGWRPVKKVRGEKWDHGNKSQRWLPGMVEPTTEVVNRVRWEMP